MKLIACSRFARHVFHSLESRHLLAAAVPELVLDINERSGPSSTPTDITAVGSAVFFAADDGVNGKQLWKSDASGTSLVRAITGVSGGAYPAELTAFGDTLMFIAYPGSTLTRLWRSDGTQAGTFQVTGSDQLSPYSPSQLTVSGGKLFFTATNTLGRELWVSDGTASGTKVVADLSTSGSGNSSISGLRAFNGGVIFDGYTTSSGSGLFISDGTAAGTRRIGPPVLTEAVQPFAILGNRFVFTGFQNSTGYEIWSSDGTLAGTTLIADITPGSSSSYPGNLTATQNGTAYFTANNQLWRTDGTSAGTAPVNNLVPGNSTVPVLAIGETVYLRSGGDIWRSDGTPEGTSLAIDLPSGGSSPRGYYDFDGSLVFVTDNSGQSIIYQADAESGGPIHHARNIPLPTTFADVGGFLFFAADDGIAGVELWKTDGTPSGASRVADVRPGSGSSGPHNLTALGEKVLFLANDQIHGTEPWSVDGSGARLLADAVAGADGVYNSPQFLLPGNGYAYGYYGGQYWITDGTPAGTRPFDGSYGVIGEPPADVVRLGSQYFFAGYDNTGPDPFGKELWATDGTPGGRRRVLDIYPGGQSSNPSRLSVVGDLLYFTANDGVHGEEWWRTDGTEAGTFMVSDIGPDALSGIITLTQPAVEMGGYAYFTASNREFLSTSLQLWRSDGTANGTALVFELPFGRTLSGALYAGESRLFFTDYVNQRQLWVTDGTAAGTHVIPTPDNEAGKYVGDVAVIGDTAFFSANAVGGHRLWRTDGTAFGTRVYQQAWLGTSSFPQRDVEAAGGSIYFAGADALHSLEIWRLSPDVVPPTVVERSIDLERFPFSAMIRFSEDVGDSITAADFVLVNSQTGSAVSGVTLLVSYDPQTDSLTVTIPSALGDGDYRLSRVGIINDADGNALTDAVTFNFHILAGDINRDRSVDFSDLLILAQNYGLAGRTYSQGNVDYSPDGRVDFNDLLILAQRYGTTLSAVPAVAAAPKRSRAAADVLGEPTLLN